jgi:hypothetical protein
LFVPKEAVLFAQIGLREVGLFLPVGHDAIEIFVGGVVVERAAGKGAIEDRKGDDEEANG